MNKITIKEKYDPAIKIVFVAYFLILVKLIFFKFPLDMVLSSIKNTGLGVPVSMNLIPFKTILPYVGDVSYSKVAIRNLLGNILLFLPFGLLLPAIKTGVDSYKKMFIFSVLFSLFFEATQLLLRIGSFDVDDLILNTLGAMLGYFLFNKFFIREFDKN
jgi:glycopeptide antibiotics resistance protein